MKKALVRTKPKHPFTLVVSDNSANIQSTFSSPLNLQANRDIELAMVNLETYYSFANSQIFELATIRSSGVLMRERLGHFPHPNWML